MTSPDDVILHPAIAALQAPNTESTKPVDLGTPPVSEPAPWTDEAGQLLLAEITALASRRGFRLAAEVEVIEGSVFRARPVLRRA